SGEPHHAAVARRSGGVGRDRPLGGDLVAVAGGEGLGEGLHGAVVGVSGDLGGGGDLDAVDDEARTDRGVAVPSGPGGDIAGHRLVSSRWRMIRALPAVTARAARA